MAVVLLFLSLLQLDDQSREVVVLATGKDGVAAGGPEGQRRVRFTGRIVEYTGQSLVIRTKGGKENELPSGRVVSITAAWTPHHQRGDQLLEQHRYADALKEYGAAVNDERRRWARRRLFSQSVWCLRNLGETTRAGDLFLRIVEEDPTTVYFDCIPLTWRAHQAEPALASRAQSWLDRESSAAKLMGASWLLSGQRRAAATVALRQLTDDADRRIAMLADAQLWRSRAAIAPQPEVEGRREQLHNTPKSLRAGPYYLLGRAAYRNGLYEEAALALMRVPIMYPHERALSAAALVEAGRALGKLDRLEEAAGLYREVKANYPSDAAMAEQRLKEMAEGRQ